MMSGTKNDFQIDAHEMTFSANQISFQIIMANNDFENLPWRVFFQIGPKLLQGVALAMDHRWRQLAKLSRLALVLQLVLVVVH